MDEVVGLTAFCLLCSVKAMLLLIDCKDYMVLTNAIPSLNGTMQGNEDRKKEVNSPPLEVGLDLIL